MVQVILFSEIEGCESTGYLARMWTDLLSSFGVCGPLRFVNDLILGWTLNPVRKFFLESSPYKPFWAIWKEEDPTFFLNGLNILLSIPSSSASFCPNVDGSFVRIVLPWFYGYAYMFCGWAGLFRPSFVFPVYSFPFNGIGFSFA